jgi:hypothetical protein
LWSSNSLVRYKTYRRFSIGTEELIFQSQVKNGTSTFLFSFRSLAL